MSSEIESLIDEGRLKDAKRKIEELLKREDRPEYHYYLALIYLAKGKLNNSIKEVNKAIKEDQNKAIYYLVLAKAEYELGVRNEDQNKLKSSYNHLRKIEELDEENNIKNAEEYLFLKSSVLYELEKYDEALNSLEEIPNKTTANYFKLKGDILYNLKRYKEAIESYNEALKHRESDSDIYYALALSYYKLGELNKALESVQKAININTDNPYYYEEEAQILAKLKKHNEAIDAIQKALSIDPDNPLLKASQILILIAVGKRDEAIKIMDEHYKEAFEIEIDTLCEDLEGRMSEFNEEVKKALREIQLKYC
ncbi:MAG: tetratricopeptide repeat protein [Sulfolobus sp.]|nr:tetratricopeptide repeat protein [Sulfolobus sp.]